MSTTTANLQLKKPAMTDLVSTTITDLGSNFDTIDSSLAEIMKLSSISNVVNDMATYYHIRLPAGTYQIDLSLPDNIILEGDGMELTWIQGQVKLGSNSIIRNLKIGYTEKEFTFQTVANNSKIDKCHFVQGLSSTSDGGAIHANGVLATNIIFKDCLITDSLSNGVKFIDKGNPNEHFENIKFKNCQFYNNARMNFEIIERQDGTIPVTTGYKNINLIDCIFKGRTSMGTGMDTFINVSFDSIMLSDNSGFAGGYSTIRDCTFTDGYYCLEMAGAIQMTEEDNTFTGGVNMCISTSKINNNMNKNKFKNNIINSNVPSVFQGMNNKINDNDWYLGNGGYVRLYQCERNEFHHNTIDTANPYALNIDTSPRNMIDDCYLSTSRAGSSNQQVILFVYANSTQNTIRDSTLIQGVGGGLLYTESLGAVSNRFINNTDSTGTLRIGSSALDKLTMGISGSTNFTFSITNKNITAQSPLYVKIRWVGRLNNAPVGGEITLLFNTYSSANTAPTIIQTGTNVTVSSVTNADGTVTFTIASAANSTSSWSGEVEMISSVFSDWGY